MFIAYIHIYVEMKQNNETVLYHRKFFTILVFGLKKTTDQICEGIITFPVWQMRRQFSNLDDSQRFAFTGVSLQNNLK